MAAIVPEVIEGLEVGAARVANSGLPSAIRRGLGYGASAGGGLYAVNEVSQIVRNLSEGVKSGIDDVSSIGSSISSGYKATEAAAEKTYNDYLKPVIEGGESLVSQTFQSYARGDQIGAAGFAALTGPNTDASVIQKPNDYARGVVYDRTKFPVAVPPPSSTTPQPVKQPIILPGNTAGLSHIRFPVKIDRSNFMQNAPAKPQGIYAPTTPGTPGNTKSTTMDAPPDHFQTFQKVNPPMPGAPTSTPLATPIGPPGEEATMSFKQPIPAPLTALAPTPI